MSWDKEGAINALDSQECFVCGCNRPIYVVATVHGKQDLHFPCCSTKCLEELQMLYLKIMSEQ